MIRSPQRGASILSQRDLRVNHSFVIASFMEISFRLVITYFALIIEISIQSAIRDQSAGSEIRYFCKQSSIKANSQENLSKKLSLY